MDEISAPDGEYPAGSSVLMQFVVLGLDLGKKKKKVKFSFSSLCLAQAQQFEVQILRCESNLSSGIWLLGVIWTHN